MKVKALREVYIEPLPCPFCGEKDNLKLEWVDDCTWMSCKECGSGGPSIFNDGDDHEEDAVLEWNRRGGNDREPVEARDRANHSSGDT